jgi:Uma2 family endonuclease
MSLALQMDQGPWMTAEEFMNWPGDGTGRRYQLIDGELVAMAPPATRHARLLSRIDRRLGAHLERTRPECETLITPGVQPRADAARNVRSPDLVVSCDRDEGKFVEAPVLIVEILSPSNARETREAVRACLSIPSLLEVLILSSEAVVAEILTRDGAGHWPAEPERSGPGDTFRLDSLGFACAMDELYAGLGLT